jgi:hypothetical protein
MKKNLIFENFIENPIDSISESDNIREWLDMDIRTSLLYSASNNKVTNTLYIISAIDFVF